MGKKSDRFIQEAKNAVTLIPVNNRGNILVVDDSRLNINFIAEMLIGEGYGVVTAYNGKQAMLALETAIPDLILLDVMMPGESGFDVCMKIRQNPVTSEIPVIFLTALKDVNERVTGLQAGGNDYLVKPFQNEELAARIETHIQISRLKRKEKKYSRDLMESEQKFTLAFKTAPYAITIAEPASGKIIEINNGFTAISGYTTEEVIGKTTIDLNLWTNDADRKNVVNDLLNNVYVNNREYCFNAKSGKLIHGLFSAQIIRSEKGDFIFSSINDISDRKKLEGILKESENNFRAIFENNSAAIAIIEPDTTISMVNDAFCQISGYNREDVIGTCWTKLIPPRDLERLKEYNRLRLSGSGNAPEKYEFTFNHKNGSIKHALMSVTMMQRGNKILTSFIDITKRKQAEDELKLEEARLEGLLRISQYHADTVQGFLDYALDEAIRLTGSKIGYIYFYNENKKEFILNSWSKEVMKECAVVNPRTRYELEKTGIWGEAVRQRKAIIKNNFQAHDKLKKGYPEGHVHLNRFLSIPVFSNKKIVAVVGVANKETGYFDADTRQLSLLMDAVWKYSERIEVEKKLEESEKFYHSLFDNMLEGYAYCKMYYEDGKPVDFRYLNVNNSFESLTGLKNATGKMVTELIPGIREEDNGLFEIYGKVAKTGIPNQFETYVKSLDMWFKISVFRPEKDHFVAVFDVITERKTIEQNLIKSNRELRESNKELEQFAYVASHDLQEPLRMISSYTQLLERKYKDKLDQGAKEYINFAVDGANRLQLLINDLLSFSRIHTKMKPAVKTDVYAALGQAISNLKITIRERNAIILNDDLPEIYVDESQLVLLFQNLLSNAMKFCVLKPCIHISAEPNNKFWLFSVKDNGIGIDMQFEEKIFAVFQRLHSRNEYSGTGIGLAICKKIVEKHGGEIWVESEPGQGSVFYFTFPENPAEAPKERD